MMWTERVNKLSSQNYVYMLGENSFKNSNVKNLLANVLENLQMSEKSLSSYE